MRLIYCVMGKIRSNGTIFNQKCVRFLFGKLLIVSILFIFCRFPELIGPNPGSKFAAPLIGLLAEISLRAADLSYHGYRQGLKESCSPRNVPRFLVVAAIYLISTNPRTEPGCIFA